MDISDGQVSDKDGYKSRSNTVKARSKIAKERIWKEAEFASRVLQEKCPRWNADTLETSCQCDDEEFQELITVAQKTVVTPQVPR